jgi:hypothetical protein
MVGAAGKAGAVGAAGAAGTEAAAELQATQWRLRWRTGDVAQRRRWRTGAGGHRGSSQPESWTGGGAASARTRRAGVYAPLDWDNLPGRATRLLYRVEGGGDNGKPGRTGHHPRVAVTRVLICAVGALVITPRDVISHRFTLSLFKGLSRDQRTNLRSSYNGRLHSYI